MHMEAETEFSNAIKYLPQVYHYYLHRASAAYLQGNLKQAFEDYKKVVELDPTNEIAWARLQSFGDVSELASKPAVARKSSLPSLKANQVEPKKLPHVRDRSPVRLSSGEREFYDDLIARRTRVRDSLRSQLGYKTDKKLDTRPVDVRFKDTRQGSFTLREMFLSSFF
mmetsp:Transcript_5590/g.19634  ORF Transcript_5590/g.19634 Transcript_5590/m.19634 type:complete len:168 (+) Transcript_5590:1426-1929(+)